MISFLLGMSVYVWVGLGQSLVCGFDAFPLLLGGQPPI